MKSFKYRSRKMISAFLVIIMLLPLVSTIQVALADSTQPEANITLSEGGSNPPGVVIPPDMIDPPSPPAQSPSAPSVGLQEAPESYKIYPVPQSIVYQPEGFAITGEVNIYLGNSDDIVTKNKIIAVLEDEGIAYSFGNTIAPDKINIILGVKGGDVIANEYFDESEFANVSALTPGIGFDGYILGTRDNNIVIMGRDDGCVYYGVTTLKQILAQSHVIRNMLINDFADNNVRGTVEGYYGIPWSFEVRKSIIEMSGDFKLNSYVYAPKDDPYHFGPRWAEPYPEDELEQLRQLVEIANANNVSFVWTTHVSQYMDFFDGDDEFNATRSVKTGSQWVESDREDNWNIPNGQKAIDAYSEEETYAKLFAKYEQLYSIGVRQFGFLIDDINFELARFNILHYVTAANRIVEWGKEKGDVGPLMVCPTYYYEADIAYNGHTFMRTIKGNPYANNGNGVMVVPPSASDPAWSGDAVYVQEPGFDESIQIMYTGEHVMSSINSTNNNWFINTSALAGTAGENPIYSQTGMRRPPLIWWNYPVTDYMASRIMMGPTPINGSNMGLNPNAKGTMHGVVANPMQQGYASEIALFGLADYTWHMDGYDAKQNWQDSFAYLYPEVADSLYIFAQHNQTGTYNVDYMPQNQESEDLRSFLINFQTAIELSTMNPVLVQTTGAALKREIEVLAAAIQDIKLNGSKLLLDDIEPWLDKGASLCRTIEYGIKAYDAYFANDEIALWENYSLTQVEKLSWPSIVSPLLNGTVITEVGTQYLKPLTDTLLSRLDALTASNSPYDKKTTTNRAYTNILAQKGVSIGTSGTVSTLSLASVNTLDASRYVGIMLDSVRKITGISVDGTMPEGLTVEYSLNGAEWTTVAELPATFEELFVRYVRIINKTGLPISTAELSALRVTVSAGETYPGTATTNIPIWESNIADNLTTTSLTTSFWSSRSQQVGDRITITYNQPAVVYDLVLYSSNTDNVKEGYMEISEDGETWTKIMDMNVNVGLETIGTTSYAIERAYVGGLTVKYLRIISTGTSNNWCRLYSLQFNVQSGHSNGTAPSSMVESGGWATVAIDESLATAFSATGTDKLTYTLSEYTNATELIILQNASAISGASIRALVIKNGEEEWVELGVLDEAYMTYSLSDYDGLLKAEISWTPETSPVMIHEIATKTRVDKTELLKLISDAQALDLTAGELVLLNKAEAVAYDDNATTKAVAGVIVKIHPIVNPVTSLRITNVSGAAAVLMVTLTRNSKTQFKAIVNPNATTDGIVWSTSNSSFATVDPCGLVTTEALAGTVTLTAKAPSGVQYSIILRIV